MWSTMSYAMLYLMLYARTYDMQVKTYDVVYDENIQCRTSDLRYRMHVRHRMLRCRTCLTYDIDILCRTCTTYDIVRVKFRTCITYDIVCNIGIIRCRTSDVRHRTSARIQMLEENRISLLNLDGRPAVEASSGKMDCPTKGQIVLPTNVCPISLVMLLNCTEVDGRHCDSTSTAGGGI
jgi:hypothetical protein